MRMRIRGSSIWISLGIYRAKERSDCITSFSLLRGPLYREHCGRARKGVVEYSGVSSLWSTGTHWLALLAGRCLAGIFMIPYIVGR